MEADTRVVPSVELEIPMLNAGVGAAPDSVGAVISSPDVVEATEYASVVNRGAPPADTWTSEGGLKLKLYKVISQVVAEAGAKVEIPRPPKSYLKDQERWEENPSDPDYLEALQRAKVRQGIASIQIYLALGTAVISLPEGKGAAETEEWATDLEELGVEIPPVSRRNSRYCAWLRFYMLNDADFTSLIRATMLYSGHVSETQVAEVVDSFRGDGSGGDNNGSTPTAES